ncbi:DUF2169 domain-containing protein [Serratia ureilytica]|jgi:uncharacterized protein YjbI with pentapeptide repeats|uniref:DUF2169 family type VI secretion system accessory protein n=1 Tax=Serratia TaxID=613 RepID=UPI0018D32DEF|nr:DUF2169 domain-containing protein [Serratia ureilytica]MBH1909522.1 DUF2169 domain-containing protein [Serratia ureilytica]
MKVVKPLRLSTLHRPYRWQGENYLGVSVLALADMGASPRLRPEPELWQLASEELTLSGGVLDLAFPKACAEFLATGYAYTHHQADKTACAVKIQLDTLEKTLVVFGDRHWINDRPSSPLPFDEMRLDWSRAFGGPQWVENPHGLGANPETLPRGSRCPLPNIEPLHNRLSSPRQTALPVSFDALDINWPRRFSRIGKKYDANWLQNEFPGLASDTDWRLFNMADHDQQWPQRDALPSGATYRIWNMHPQIPCQQGQLPTWIARCFINRLRHGEPEIEEIAMRHTTVWFFPHRQQMLLIYHGSVRIDEDDAADVLHLMPALELSGAARSANHYRKVLRQRSDTEKGGLFAFREKELVPESAIGPWLDTKQTTEESPAVRNLTRYQQHLQQHYRDRRLSEGQDIDEALPPTERPALDELPDYVERLEQEAEQRQQALYDELRAQGVDPQSVVEAPPSSSGHENFQQMRDMLYQHSDPADRRRLEEQEQALYQAYLMTAQSQGPALRLSGDLATIIRNRAMATQRGDKNFSGIDLTGADLSGLDLTGADFSRCLLENANFSGCRLDHANFEQAMLARADFTGARLQGANLNHASLALAHCENADFSHATLVETNIQETLFKNCNFTGSRLEQLAGYRTFMTQCNFSQATLCVITMMALTLSQLKFHQAKLEKVTFIRCQLEGFDFSHARLDTCSLVETRAEGCSFQGARLQTCSFVAQSAMPRANFSEATLKQCNLRQLPLHQACFRLARIDNSDFSEAQLTAANLQKANGNGSLFIRCDFSNADLTNASFVSAVMQKSLFSGADLRGANLFRADLSQSRIDGSTKIDGAYTRQTKTLPRTVQEKL